MINFTNNALLEKLEEEHPDNIAAIRGLSHDERIAYMAKIELIDYIRMLIEEQPNQTRKDKR